METTLLLEVCDEVGLDPTVHRLSDRAPLVQVAKQVNHECGLPSVLAWIVALKSLVNR